MDSDNYIAGDERPVGACLSCKDKGAHKVASASTSKYDFPRWIYVILEVHVSEGMLCRKCYGILTRIDRLSKTFRQRYDEGRTIGAQDDDMNSFNIILQRLPCPEPEADNDEEEFSPAMKYERISADMQTTHLRCSDNEETSPLPLVQDAGSAEDESPLPVPEGQLDEDYKPDKVETPQSQRKRGRPKKGNTDVIKIPRPTRSYTRRPIKLEVPREGSSTSNDAAGEITRFVRKACDETEVRLSTQKEQQKRYREKLNEKIQNGDLPYLCDTCGKGFASVGIMRHHVKIRHEKPFACDQCSYRTGERRDLRVHMGRHAGERPFLCDDCGRRFKDVNHFRKHSQLHSKGEIRPPGRRDMRPETKRAVCTICNSSIKADYLKRHMKIHERDKVQEEFVCDTCGLKFAWKASLTWHERKEHGLSYECTVCPKVCLDRSKLIKHMRVHTRTKSKQPKTMALVPPPPVYISQRIQDPKLQIPTDEQSQVPSDRLLQLIVHPSLPIATEQAQLPNDGQLHISNNLQLHGSNGQQVQVLGNGGPQIPNAQKPQIPVDQHAQIATESAGAFTQSSAPFSLAYPVDIIRGLGSFYPS